MTFGPFLGESKRTVGPPLRRLCRAMMRFIAKLRSVRYYGGMPLDARTVTDDIVLQEGL